jgi:hypothetical protein
MEPEISPQAEPELEPVQAPARTHRPLPLVICWALAPAMLMALAGVCMELKTDDALPSILLFLGGLGGIPALFLWSIWMVYPANWTTPAKVVAVVPIFAVMCAVNLFLAFGACAMIDPPFHIQ